MGSLSQRLPSHVAGDGFSAVHNLYIKAASSDVGWYIGSSKLEGQGIFATQDYEAGDRIGIAMTSGGEDEFGAKIWNLTEMARYCNHQQKANADLVKSDNLCYLSANRTIKTDDEIFSSYAQVARTVGPHSRMLWNNKPIPTSDLSDLRELDEG